MIESSDSWNTENSARASRRSAPRGSRGINAVTMRAMTPPARPSKKRENSPPGGTGSSITIAEGTAAATANAGWGESARPTMNTTVSTTTSCQSPVPKTSDRASARARPRRMPSTLSATRRGRASREKPSELMVTVTASSGAG
jgi:hypothetical protein